MRVARERVDLHVNCARVARSAQRQAQSAVAVAGTDGDTDTVAEDEYGIRGGATQAGSYLHGSSFVGTTPSPVASPPINQLRLKRAMRDPPSLSK